MSDWRNDYRNDVREITGEAGWTLGRVFFQVFIPVLIFVIVISSIGWGIKILSQPGRIVEKTMDADNVIYNYEWFRNQYEKLQATDKQITQTASQVDQLKKDLGSDRSKWDFQDRQEYDRLNAVLLGQQNFRESVVADYNARSKMVNRAIFRGKDLPETVQ